MKVPTAVSLRAALRKGLAGDTRALAWLKDHKEAVDRMLADTIYAMHAKSLSDVTGFSPEQVTQLRSKRGLAVHTKGDPNDPQLGDERTWYAIRRFFFPGYMKKNDDGTKELVMYPPMMVLIRRQDVRKQAQLRRFSVNDPVNYKDIWSGPTSWLGADGKWRPGHNPSIRVEQHGEFVTLYGETVQGYTKEVVPCDEKCVSARGKKCECACGGENHGAGVEIVTIPFTAAEQLREALALHRHLTGVHDD